MTRTLAASLVALALSSGVVSAQTSTPPATAPMGGMQQMDKMDHMNGMHHMDNMMGMHKMPATVTAADANTGIVDVDAGGMALKLHFPPAAVKALKAGDKITVHMGFSKP